MAIPWEIWISLGFFAIVPFALLPAGIIRLRTAHGATWKAIVLCLLAMLFCVGGTLFTYSLHSSYRAALEALKRPPDPSHLRPDWGADMSKEDRTKYSQMLARTTFQDWGITVNYFDEKGTLRPYQSTSEDRARLQWRRQAVAYHEQTTGILEWAMLAWLLIPWFGMALGFFPWGALTKRSNVDAPQSAARP
jgi:hypothetical protein